jgi:PAS domain S-box-containing protein
MERNQRIEKLRRRTRAIEEAPIGITISDPQKEDNPLVYNNKTFKLMTGYDQEEIVERNCRFLQGEETDPETVSEIREAIESNESISVELKNYKKDGTEFWNKLTIAPVRDRQGVVDSWIGFQEDITERKEKTQQLRESEERFRQMAETINEGFFMLRSDYSDVIYANPACSSLHGVSNEELMKDPMAFIRHVVDEDREELIRKIQKDQLRGLPSTKLYNYRLDHPDLGLRHLRTRLYPKQAEGNFDYLVGVTTDITNIEQAHRKLEERERKFRAIFNSTFSFIGLLSLDGTVLESNETALDIVDTQLDDIRGKPFWETPWWSDSPERQQKIKDAIDRAADGEFIRFETTHTDPDGNQVPVDFSITPIENDQGDVELLVPEGRDISRQRELQEQLDEQRRFLQTIINSAPNLIFVKNWDHQFELVNDKVSEFYGLPKSQIIGRGDTQLLENREEIKSVHTDDRLVMETGETIDISEQRLEHPETGDELVFQTSKIPLDLDKPPEERRVLGIATDITQQKENEKEIQKQADLLEAINTRMPGVSFQFKVPENGEYSFTYLSQGVETLAGVTPEEAKENFDQSLKYVHEDDFDELMASIERAIEELDPWQHEYRYKLPDGTVNWVLGSSLPERQDDGSILFSGVLIDITRRKETKKRLAESQLRFRQLAENINAVFWLSDPEKQEMIYVNETYEDLWGRSREELHENANQFVEAIHPDDRERVENELPKQTEGEYDVEYRIRQPNGSVRWIRDRAFPVENDNGEVYRIAGIAEDITESKKRQQELQKTVEEKNTLLNEIHHRVKNNMQIMSSMMGLQKRELENEEKREILTVNQNRLQAMKLIHQHLYSVESVSQVDFNSYVEQLIRNIMAAYSSSEMDVQYELTIDEINLSLNESLYLGLLLQELVTNSIEHAFPVDREEQITVRFRISDGDKLRFTYEDNGKGLPPELEQSEDSNITFKMIHVLAEKQLEGTFEYEPLDEGTRFEFEFQL